MAALTSDQIRQLKQTGSPADIERMLAEVTDKRKGPDPLVRQATGDMVSSLQQENLLRSLQKFIEGGRKEHKVSFGPPPGWDPRRNVGPAPQPKQPRQPRQWGPGPGTAGGWLDQGPNLLGDSALGQLGGAAGVMGDVGMPGIPGVAEGGPPLDPQGAGMPMPKGPSEMIGPERPSVIGPTAEPEAMPEYGAMAPLGMEDLPPPDAAMNAPGMIGPSAAGPISDIPPYGGEDYFGTNRWNPDESPAGPTQAPLPVAPSPVPQAMQTGTVGPIPQGPGGPGVPVPSVDTGLQGTISGPPPGALGPVGQPGAAGLPGVASPSPNLQQLNQAAGTNRHQQEALNMFKPTAAPPQAPRAPQAPPIAPAAPAAAAGPVGQPGPTGPPGMASPGMPSMGAPSAMPPDMNADLMGVATSSPDPLGQLAMASGARPPRSVQAPKTHAFRPQIRI